MTKKKLHLTLITLQAASLAKDPLQFANQIKTLPKAITVDSVDETIQKLATDLHTIQTKLKSATEEALNLRFHKASVQLDYDGDRRNFESQQYVVITNCKDIYDRDLKPKAQFKRLTTLSQGRLADMLKPLTELCETSVLIWEVASMSEKLGKSNIKPYAAINLLKRLEDQTSKTSLSIRRKEVLDKVRENLIRLIGMDDEIIYQRIVYDKALKAFQNEGPFPDMASIQKQKSELEESTKQLEEFIQEKKAKKSKQGLSDFEKERIVLSKELQTKIASYIEALTKKMDTLSQIERLLREATDNLAEIEAETNTVSESAEKMKEIAQSAEDEGIKGILTTAMDSVSALKTSNVDGKTNLKKIESDARASFAENRKKVNKKTHDTTLVNTKTLLSEKTAEWNEAISKAKIAVESLKSTLVAKKLIDYKQGGASKVKGGEEENEGKDGGSDDKKNNSGASSSTVKKGKGMGAGLIAVIVASAVLVLGGAAAFLYFNQKPRTA